MKSALKLTLVLLALGLTATATCYASRVDNGLGRKTLSHAGRSLLDVYVNSAQSAATQSFTITSEPSGLTGGECFISGFPGNNGSPVQGPLDIKVGVGSQQNITFNSTDGPNAYVRANITGNSEVLLVNESQASGLSQISFTPTAAGQTVTFTATRMITTSPPMAACQITINFAAIDEIDISPALSAANPSFDIYSTQPDGRSGQASTQECFIKGYPGNTAANQAAVQGPMQINVTVGNTQYVGFKSVDSQLYYQELVANSTSDSALNVNQNDISGLVGTTYKPTAANIGQWTTFKAAHYLNVTPPVMACTVTINFTAVPAYPPPTPNPTPNPYSPTPKPTYSPTPKPTYSPTPKPTNTPTPTPTQTPNLPPIGTCVGPTTCTCQNGFCFNKSLNGSLTSICNPPGQQQCTLATIAPSQIGSNYANGYPASVSVCKCPNAPPTPPAPAPSPPTPPPIGTCVGPDTCQCENGYCFNMNGRDLNSICTPPGGQTCSAVNVNPKVISGNFNFGWPDSVNVCKCTATPPAPSPPAPAPPTPPPIGTCVGPSTCQCENGFCFSDSGNDLTSICTPPGGQQCSLVTVPPMAINFKYDFGYPASVSVCNCGAHSSTSPSSPPPAPVMPTPPPQTPSPPPAPVTPSPPPQTQSPPPTPTFTPQSPPPVPAGNTAGPQSSPASMG